MQTFIRTNGNGRLFYDIVITDNEDESQCNTEQRANIILKIYNSLSKLLSIPSTLGIFVNMVDHKRTTYNLLSFLPTGI